jgi:FHS family L-fucose permease-like MFS transporter
MKKLDPSDGDVLPRRYLLAFALVTSLYFLWGVPANLNDLLIRQFMKSFELSRFQAGLIQSAFYLGYFCCSIPAALILQRFGYKRGIVSGLLLYAAGSFLFWPAAHTHRYGSFLLALYVIASGLAFLETGANSFIAEMGTVEGSARRLNFAQAFNPLGAISGVIIGTVFIFSGVELTPAQVVAMKAAGTYEAYLDGETGRVLLPYLAIGLVVMAIAITMMRTTFPSRAEGKPESKLHLSWSAFEKLLFNKRLMLAVLVQFLYVGAQVCTWSYFIQYAEDYVRTGEKTGGYLLTGSLVIFAIGRFSGSYLMRWVRSSVLLIVYAVCNIVLLLLAVLKPGSAGLYALFATSFFMSIMYPTIFAIGLGAVDENVEVAGAILVMSIIGGAVVTPVVGLAAELSHSMAHALGLLLICYFAIITLGVTSLSRRTSDKAITH